MSNEARQSRYTPPAGAAEIFLVRHGESMPAVRGESFPLKDGHGDPALHPDGEAQARAVGTRLRDIGLSAIYVTTLRRTHQTAAPLAAALRLEPVVEADLREIYLGEWDGGAYRFHAAERHPDFIRAIEQQEWGEIPGAETTAQLHLRVRRGLLRIAASHPDSRVAVFVHGGVIGAAMSIATGAEPFAFNRADNGSISLLVVHGETMIARRFNDTAHLE